MSEEMNMKQAQLVYSTFGSMLDSKGWKYQRHDDKLAITCGVRGRDLPMQLVVLVNPRVQAVSVHSEMPFKIPQEKWGDMAIAAGFVNSRLINGSFDFNPVTGSLRFRVVTSFRDSILGEGLCDYMIMVSCGTIDDYNDKFFALATGNMTVEQFIAADDAR